MPYKYELHCHTGPVSRCAVTEPERLLEIYREKGYSGLVLTDHYSPMTFFYKHHLFDPLKATEQYLSSYEKLKDLGGDDFTVLLGLELRHYNTVNDYLVYGVSAEWLRAQTENMLRWREKEMYEKLHAEGFLVYQAHPFRRFIKRCDPAYIDGVEIHNGHTDKECNDMAAAWAKKLGKPVISGSDSHKENDAANGGIITDEKIRSNDDLLRILRAGEYELITTNENLRYKK